MRGSRAHVQRLVQGLYTGKDIVVRDAATIRVACYAPVRFGGTGYIIGTPSGYENGLLVVEPFFQPATRKVTDQK
jgi:hypothetical protein